MDNTYEWCELETAPQCNKLLNLDTAFFVRGIERLKRGENIVIADIMDFFPEAAEGKELARILGARSLVAVPILSTTGALTGIMGFDHTEQERKWSDEDIQTLRMVAEMVGISWEHKRAEAEKVKIQAQLLQAQKMEAIGLLAGGLAHDFNNLLTTIQGYAGMGLKNLNKNDSLFKYLNQIKKAAGRAANLTRQLLIFSRKKPAVLASLNLNQTVNNLLMMLRTLIGENITIKLDLESDLRSVKADEGNIEQVIMNLAVNARDAMPKGGRLTIKTENVTVDDEYAGIIPGSRPREFVCLIVADEGVGMSKEIVDQIFEPFFTTKEAGKGTGLGLSVVYGIVKQHQGWINVYSEEGKGSVFKIYLPALLTEVKDKIRKEVPLAVPGY